MRNIIWKRRISGTNTWLTVSKNDEVKLLWDNEHPMWSCHQCYNRHDDVVVNKQVIKIVVGSFASVTKNLEKWLESWT